MYLKNVLFTVVLIIAAKFCEIFSLGNHIANKIVHTLYRTVLLNVVPLVLHVHFYVANQSRVKEQCSRQNNVEVKEYSGSCFLLSSSTFFYVMKIQGCNIRKIIWRCYYSSWRNDLLVTVDSFCFLYFGFVDHWSSIVLFVSV